MAETLPSSVPGIFNALHGLVKEAASEISPEVAVFAFELRQYEPGRYVMISEIRGPRYEWESIGGAGFYAVMERYEIAGKVTVFSGDSPDTNESLALEVLEQTHSLFQTCVLTPVISHRTAPFLETTGPTPQIMELQDTEYQSGVGRIGGGEGGWQGVLDWQLHFEAKIAAEPA